MRSRRLDPFGARVHIATTPEQWARLSRRFKDLDDCDSSLGQANLRLEDADPLNTPHIIIYVDAAAHEGNPLVLVNTAAHEALHAAISILNHVGQPLDGADETLAYLTGLLAEWVWHAATKE